MEEIWKPLEGWGSRYEVSNLGSIRSVDTYIKRRNSSPFLKKGRVLRTRVSKTNGYVYVYLRNHPDSKNCRLHRLIASVFVDNPYNKPIIDHIDGDKTNNKSDNLRWCTHSENSNFEKSIENLKSSIKKTRSKHLYQKVFVENIKTKQKIEFNTVIDAAKFLGTKNSVISDCIRGIRNSRKGYKIYLKNMRNKENVLQWAKEKGILDKSNPLKQHEKTQEEVDELKQALIDNNMPEIIDAIGDILVTLIIQAQLNNLDIEDCLEHAYNVIKTRTGKMIDGTFVKDQS